MSRSPRSIAVVGAGPKGMYCLERLLFELGRHPDPPSLLLHIIEPHRSPGAGAVYDPTQPHWLRMNFPNDLIDGWVRGAEEVDDSGPTLLEFAATRSRTALEPDGYAPRAVVGRYLTSMFEQVTAALRNHATVIVHAARVRRIDRGSSGFVLLTADGQISADEVLVATGHASQSNVPRDGDIPAYPVDRPSGLTTIEAGSVVGIRGMGLTAIDSVLTLTEGRGGVFAPARVPGRLHYRPSGEEPMTILPFSRTGRPMTPKPDRSRGPTLPEAVWAPHRAAIDAAAASDTGVVGHITGSLLDAACAVLQRLSPATRHPRRQVEQVLAVLLARQPQASRAAVAELEMGVAIAWGRAEPDPTWALGAAWRGVYPAVVRAVGAGRVVASWSEFAALAGEMERLAFGPSPENAARVLSLVQAGLLDLSLAANPTVAHRADRVTLAASNSTRTLDVLVDAVLASPGVRPTPSPLFTGLLEDGLASTVGQVPGVRVRADATSVGCDGRDVTGLAIIGRPTEGCVLGNDTLRRTMHDEPGRWAAAVLRRASADDTVMASAP